MRSNNVIANKAIRASVGTRVSESCAQKIQRNIVCVDNGCADVLSAEESMDFFISNMQHCWDKNGTHLHCDIASKSYFYHELPWSQGLKCRFFVLVNVCSWKLLLQVLFVN